MELCDFQCSFVRWRIDTEKKGGITVSEKLPMSLNNVRAPLDCRVILTDAQGRKTYEYGLTVSCKSEQVWVDRDVWHNPNADMCAFASENDFLVVKRWDKCDKGVMLHPPSLGVQPERHRFNPREAFDRFSLDVNLIDGRQLESVDQVVEALSSDRVIVARTEYEADGYMVMTEYPVKIVNFSERERFYQVDTGPVIFPDFSMDHNSLIECLKSAFVAHNCPDWAEFLVCEPTALSDEISVYHYSRSVRVNQTRNSLFELL